jgi:N utilization substance protein A
MLDLKTMKSALEQLEQERKIPREKIIDAIEQALAAAYKKDYGKKGQIIRATIDIESGKMEFYQIKIVVDESLVRMTTEDEEEEIAEDDERVRFNEEHHILLEDAKKIKSDAKLEEEIVFPLEAQEDYGRIAAQTAKQVIIQKIREAERGAIIDEYGSKEGEIVNGFVQKVERGIVYIDFNRATGIILPEEQIPGESYRRGERIRAYLYSVEETPRGVNLKLSRTHPQLIEGLFAMEAPEIASGVVEIKAIAREAGSRSKIAVYSNDEHVDPVGSCVGQKGIRVTTVMSELGGEKIDIIPWSADMTEFISSALSPAHALDIQVSEEEHKAVVEVAADQLSLAIGKGGQNVRLAAKLTGWRIDIKGIAGEVVSSESDIISEDASGEPIKLDEGLVDDGTTA